MTHVHAAPEGDIFFPEFDWADWQLQEETHYDADERHSAAFTIARYRRKRS